MKWGDRVLKVQAINSFIQGVIWCCASLLAAPAHADTEAMLNLLKILQDRGTISQDEFEALRNTALEDEKKPAAEQEQPKKGVAKNTQDSVKVRADYKGLTVESADGNFKFNVGGRIQADANFFDEDQTPLGSGAEIRRGRLRTQGTMWRIWDYKFQVDFAEGETEINDAYIKFNGLKPVSFTLGHQKVPITLQSMTSSNWQVFQERALIDGLVDNPDIGRRRLGLNVGTHGNHWTVNSGFFGEGTDDAGKSNENWGTAGRVTFAPIAEATRVVHLGGAAYYRNFEHDPKLAFSSRLEAHVAGTRLVNTGVISEADNLLLLGGELSTVWGPFHAQGEYLRAEVGRKNGLPEPNFDGWYLQAGYFLTGESRRYEVDKGRYGRVIPKGIVGQGGWGAWEIAFRYSTLDLTDKGILGGVENNFTAGLNWWATPSILFRANYIRAGADPNSEATRLGGMDESVNIFTLRGQIVF
ncbi:Phosphate-selective porin O and P [Nitrosococcus oceani ATCC 19707]|uniref:Phosphate-selective porin O and P n=2 Tax=Nitrosococcus oceani TaxID=1229 RepID=Q3J8H2_NITOC|nr:Phosphate-selective porin O and P [Nitrosococcus oceani ATCC 19707]EDZ67787.1 Phosphate-selective porin O and P superfamily [Nitrosococcus oceani AFC27]KFI18673.1 porin [Nitrosococcus oceani C-27]